MPSLRLPPPTVHDAVPVCAPLPTTVTVTVPDAVSHAPPTVVTFWFVEYGNVRVEPFTCVNATVGAVLSIVIAFEPDDAEFVAASAWAAVTLYVPSADRFGLVVYDHAPAVHGAEPDCDAAPVIATLTVATSPVAVPHAPPTVVTSEFSENGKVTVLV